jgi:hypothetical protein
VGPFAGSCVLKKACGSLNGTVCGLVCIKDVMLEYPYVCVCVFICMYACMYVYYTYIYIYIHGEWRSITGFSHACTQ